MFVNNAERVDYGSKFNVLYLESTSSDSRNINISELFDLLDQKFIKVSVEDFLILEVASDLIIEKGFNPNFHFEELFLHINEIKQNNEKYQTKLTQKRQETMKKHVHGVLGYVFEQIDYKNILLIDETLTQDEIDFLKNNHNFLYLDFFTENKKTYIFEFFNI